jgi:putative component of membrane protein insertase Oxa1/YidC/SpoIIIJ protein YidD
MKKIVISLINTYQKIPLKSHNSCVFIPTCSQYTKESIEKHGLSKGLLHGFLRICGKFDEVKMSASHCLAMRALK